MANRDIEINHDMYPPNNGKESVVSKKIIRGNVVERRKGFLDKLSCSEDFKDVIDYVWNDIFVPAAKNLFYDCMVGGLRSSIYGEGGRRDGRSDSRYGREGGPRYTSYSSRYRDEDRRDRSYGRDVRRVYDEVILESRADALDVLKRMNVVIDESGSVTVGDLYEMVGRRSDFTDNDYGWKDLTGGRVCTVREGFLLDLPRPRLLR